MQSTLTPIFRLFLLLLLLPFGVASAQTPFYWVNGPGDWDDLNHWAKAPGNGPINLTGEIPSENNIVIIDQFSGLTSGDVLNVPAGNFAVRDLVVTTDEDFEFHFAGVSGNNVTMTVFGDLTLSEEMEVTYAVDPNSFGQYNKWRFDGAGDHDLTTPGKELMVVELLDEDGTYNQLTPLKASLQIRVFGGTWNANGYDVTTGKILFNDGIPSNGSHLAKVFNPAGASIYAEEWNSVSTYGSLTVNGSHKIYVARFDGSPAQGAVEFSFDEIHLLEYSDDPINGSSSVVNHNNFECTGCQIEKLIIEDSGRTKLAGRFTINGDLVVTVPETSVEFSGGNLRSNEVTINGKITVPPVANCEKRTVFKNVHNEFTSLLRTSGTLNVKDAILVNIQASGGATFNLTNGVLRGSSSGWNLAGAPESRNLTWFGPGDWDDPNQWLLPNGAPAGCIPNLTDNVLLNSNSKGNLRIPANYTAQCNDFIWTNKDNLTLTLDGTLSLKSTLEVSGSFEIDNSATVAAINRHEIIFSSTSNNTITTEAVALPDLRFIGNAGEWTLNDNLTCDRISFEGGTLSTQGEDVMTDVWNSLTENTKTYNFSTSRITVNGEFVLSQSSDSGVTVNPGTSLIVCSELTSTIQELYDVRLVNNSPVSLGAYPYSFSSLQLGGTGPVSTTFDLTLNDLVFITDGATLALDINHELTLNGGIESVTTAANPGTLKSGTTGTQAELNRETGNLCVTGPVAFQDINSVAAGNIHAPAGRDDGNNNGIDFSRGTPANALYWIGGNGNYSVRSNWSGVSGGCPADQNPNTTNSVFFDTNGFTESGQTVTVPTGSRARFAHVLSPMEINLNVEGTFDVGDLTINGGWLNLQGNSMRANSVMLESGGLFTSEIDNLNTNFLEGTSGIFIARTGSETNARLENQGANILVESGATLTLDGVSTNEIGGNITNSGDLIVEDDLVNTGTITSIGANTWLIFRGGNPSTFTPGNINLDNLRSDKSGLDLNLAGDLTVNKILDLTTGDDNKLNIGNADLILGRDATIIGTGPNSFVATNGTGYLTKEVVSAGSFIFPIGNSEDQTPLTANFTGSLSGEAGIKVRVISEKAQNLPADATDYLNLHWEVVAENITNYENEVSATFPTGENAGNVALIKGASYNGSEWSYRNADRTPGTVTGTLTATSAIFTGTNFYATMTPTVFLQGGYDVVTGQMSTELAAQGLIPLNSPYPDAPAIAPTIPANAVDWVKLEIRRVSNPKIILSAKSVLLLADGSLVNADGSALGIKNGSLTGYLAVHHRNHLPVRTSGAYFFDSRPSVNFSEANVVYANSAVTTNPQLKLLEVGTYGLWSGDANGDGRITYNGGANDRVPALLAVGFSTPNNFLAGYRIEDVNLDGEVTYEGDNNDRTPVLLNVGTTTPNRTLSAHLE